ncbi:hypothetical protein [Nocardia sp. NPDC051570]|uniref:hypothetical protein n=1 Tax=Nocardia sp. NPDC051570 TaxID=3364324 RepID=UPI00378F4A8C
MLPTPTVADATGGHRSRSGPRSAEQLLAGLAAAAVEGKLLPTPRATDGTHGGPNQRGSSGDLMLPSAVTRMLPTPKASDARRGSSAAERRRKSPSLSAVDALLPTPTACDGTGGGVHPDRRAGHTRQMADYALLDGSARWGRYGPAIARQQRLSRPAPDPTEPGRHGNPRLAAAWSEWMLWLPAGWVTAPDLALSRRDQLRLLGNAVVPPQALAGFRLLAAIRPHLPE